MADELKCPNCATPAASGSEGKIVCATCGGTFEFHAGEAKLKSIGEIDQIKADVEELKQRLPASSPAQPPEEPSDTPDSPFDDDPDIGDDEEDEDDF